MADMFNLFGEMGMENSPVPPMINTGSLYDYITGAFVPGANGETYVDGGIAPTNGVHGESGTFKSTVCDGMLVNALARWPDTQFLNYDTEDCKRNPRRIVGMSSLYLDDPVKREAHLTDLENRMRVKNLTDFTYVEDFLEAVHDIYNRKMKTIKQWEVETPLYDSKTGKNKRMILPTFITIDSLSKASVKSVDEHLLKHGDTSSEGNMSNATEARLKGKILRRLQPMTGKAGIYFVYVGQNTQQMSTGNAMPSKQTQYMKPGDRVKGVSGDYMYLVQSDFEVRSPRPCFDTNKECDYPYPSGITMPTEMSEVTMIVNRCKNHGGGTKFLPVVSQSHGYEPNLTNYNFLRNAGYYGLGRDKTRPRPALRPDLFFMRTTAYEKLLDPMTARAVELIAQLHMLQTAWTLSESDIPFSITPEQLHDFLNKSGYAQNDILSSRGWWTYAKNDQPYLSLHDVLAIAVGKYRPKFWAVPAAQKKAA